MYADVVLDPLTWPSPAGLTPTMANMSCHVRVPGSSVSSGEWFTALERLSGTDGALDTTLPLMLST